MTYDSAAARTGKTAHHSGLEWSKQALDIYTSRNVSKEKLLIGVPFYGRTLELQNSSHHDLGAPITDKPSGFLNYVDFCLDIKNNNWGLDFGKKYLHFDPYTFNDTTWVSFNVPNDAYLKSKFVAENGYGGVLIWEIGVDDLRPQCCPKNYPLLRAINYGLFEKGDSVIGGDDHLCSITTPVSSSSAFVVGIVQYFIVLLALAFLY